MMMTMEMRRGWHRWWRGFDAIDDDDDDEIYGGGFFW